MVLGGHCRHENLPDLEPEYIGSPTLLKRYLWTYNNKIHIQFFSLKFISQFTFCFFNCCFLTFPGISIMVMASPEVGVSKGISPFICFLSHFWRPLPPVPHSIQNSILIRYSLFFQPLTCFRRCCLPYHIQGSKFWVLFQSR